jgi:hypothetical protein
MELMTRLTEGLIAYASKDMIAKLVGPTFDYLGEGLKSFVEKRQNNVVSIFAKANRKLGDNLNKEGIVSPRVLKRVLDEGSFCEDNLTQEYFAGLLASSRTSPDDELGGNDELLPYLSIVEQMSAKDILFHYILYYSFAMNVFRDEKINLFMSSEVNKRTVCFPVTTLVQMFGHENFSATLSEVCTNSFKESMLSQYKFGKQSDNVADLDSESAFLRANPTLYGLNLFLKANAAPESILLEPTNKKIEWIESLEKQTTIMPMPSVHIK